MSSTFWTQKRPIFTLLIYTMNKFERELEKWNKGILRGAQAKLAKELRVSTATVALWSTGKRHPSKGYIAQMAHLFHLDNYSVMRLFTAGKYQEPVMQNTTDLREENTPENAYKTDYKKVSSVAGQSNSVSLPLLAHVPVQYPLLDESEVETWWTFPRRYAKGAKYLLHWAVTNTKTHNNDLCLIKPSSELQADKMMLLRTPQGYTIRRTYAAKGKIWLYKENKKTGRSYAFSQVIPVGIVVCKLENID